MGRWGRIYEVWTWGRCSHNYTHASQRYLQTAYDFRRCSWCCDQIFEDRECFLLQMKCMLSESVEIISYCVWLMISVWENEPKLKEKTVNHFALRHLRHYWWIEVYTRSEHGKSIKQYARIVWASLISSLEVARYDCLPHRFSPTFQPPLFSVENWKKKAIFNSCLNRCNFWKLFCFGYSCFLFHDCPLAGNKRRLFEIFFCYLIRWPLL